MNLDHNEILKPLLVTICVLAAAQVALAVDHAAALKDYLTDDVAAVVYLDLSKVDVVGMVAWADEVGLLNDELRQRATQLAVSVQGRFDRFVNFGVGHVYVLLRVSDPGRQYPTWVVPVAETGNPRAVRELMLSVKPDQFPVECEVIDGYVLGAMNPEQLQMLKTKRPTEPRDLADAWEALGQGAGGLIVFGDQDSRRVMREMFPQLPPPFDAIDGRLLADRLSWGGLSVNLPPKPSLEFLLETTDNATATTIDASITQVLKMARSDSLLQFKIEQRLQEALTGELTPRVDGTRVRISLHDVGQISRLLAPPIQQARQGARRRTRMNQFKHIALAFHNYADRHKMFPANANYANDGKPLLSWRVPLLPYLEQGELYGQFNLDEPWDSEHNKKLISRMPEVFADPDPALRAISRAGKTTYVVPVAAETLFPGNEQLTFKDVTDGTSNTIMFVEVNPERAVIWTKPDDWEVDLDDPWAGLRRNDRNWFTASFCDGSAHIFDEQRVPAKKLRALLTRAGGEVIEW
ncbi:MAG: DUF1559 domain-containing protein [Planctomycetes bacterium]|nr:DUF1559 domain-containing protein [Planctomycetota bacterium]